MKTVYYTACSLDGFSATLDDSLEWLFPLRELEATSYPAFIRERRCDRDGPSHLRVNAPAHDQPAS